MGERSRAFVFGQPDLAQPVQPVLVGPAAAHGADVPGLRAQRHFEDRHVELGIVGEHADHGARFHGVLARNRCGQSTTTSSASGNRAWVAKMGRASHTVTR